jgi:hypothetical protein
MNVSSCNLKHPTLDQCTCKKGSYRFVFKNQAWPWSPSCIWRVPISYTVPMPSVIQTASTTSTSTSVAIDHSQINSVGRDQCNSSNYTNISYSAADHENDLAVLNPVDRSGYYVPPCIRGTRQWIIDQIRNWLSNPLAHNILRVSLSHNRHQSPGIGKSTIASTIVSQLAEMGHPSCNFFFKWDTALGAVWRMVAFDLAYTDTVFADRQQSEGKEGGYHEGRISGCITRI